MLNFSDKDTCYKNKSRTFDPALKGERRGYNRELGLYTARLWSGPSVQNDRRAEGKTEFFQFFYEVLQKNLLRRAFENYHPPILAVVLKWVLSG